ncbi:hypothetical protein O181_056060 [Austropuccinia psidii MF-1]|uniref:Reverse transcriptase n=1 Tax=Austropuccinia psidii MF-1 TaxID=1389203 RepID=A0A9Q3E5H2_9BASI|nr:hypothetical protein [Austropuccinia psidii MF-1]
MNQLLTLFNGSSIFSKIDLPGAYNVLRIKESDEHLACFRTKYGSYKYLVTPLGLTNAPGSFQNLFNDIFHDLLDIYVVVYLDEIMVFSKSEEEHVAHVSTVLARLRANNLFATAYNCLFHASSVQYLGDVVSSEGLKMDQAKVQQILNLPPPGSLKALQSFLAFANFYCHFIKNYSKKISSLTSFLKKYSHFPLNEEALRQFHQLKEAFTIAPILPHFDPTLPTIVETDESDYALSAVLSQISDSELLGIVWALKRWRAFLLSLSSSFEVLTNHSSLQYFMSSNILTHHQARWAKYFSEFCFSITYLPGHLVTLPDALSRWDKVYPERGENLISKNPMNYQKIIKQDEIQASMFFAVKVESFSSFIDSIQKALWQDYQYRSIPQDLGKGKSVQYYSLYFSYKLLLSKDWVVVPNDPTIQLSILQKRHDSPLAGHPGQENTLKLVKLDFNWPGMTQFINDYVSFCQQCSRNKNIHHKKFGLLKPLQIPNGPWIGLSMLPQDGPSKSPADSQLAFSKKPQGSSIIPLPCQFLPPFHQELFKEEQFTHQFPQERFLFAPQLGSSQSVSPTQRGFHHRSTPSLPTIVETDASDYASGAVLSQVSDSGKHPIAFYSHKSIPAELNYEIHDKELLGIVWALKCWRAFLLSLSSPFAVLTDHSSLQCFMSSKVLNCRQARWAEFHFSITYCPGHLATLLEALSRRDDKKLWEDSQYRSILQELGKGKSVQDYSIDSSSQLLLFKDRVVVPNDPTIQLSILQKHHDSPLAGHPGQEKTLKLVKRDFHWSGMTQFINNYVSSCQQCSRNKNIHHKKSGLLKPLPIPNGPWICLPMDFITQLPLSKSFDSILVLVDRFSKMAVFIPTMSSITSLDLAHLLIKNIFSKHGLPSSILSDRVSTHTYHLNLPSQWKSIHSVFHISLLEPVKTSTIPNWHQEPPPPIIIEEEEEWEVTQILDSKLKRRKLWYLVEWKGFSQDSERSTWKPAENLKNCPELVKDFHSLYLEKPGPNSSKA